MIKKLVIGLVMAVNISAYAVPNIWERSLEDGVEIYDLSDTNNRGLSIDCHLSGENGAYYAPDINVDSWYDLSSEEFTLVFNDETSLKIPLSMDHRIGASAWVDFTLAIENAENIKIYYNDKLFADFYPQNTQEMQGLSEFCKPKMYR